jgi:hypothetical protein
VQRIDAVAWSRHLEHLARGVEWTAAPPVQAWGCADPGSAGRLWTVAAAAPETTDATAAEAVVAELVTPGDGPLRPMSDADAVEVWIDDDLSMLHALWRLARTLRRTAWHARASAAALWHVEHLGAENATHRPWALHVFLLEGSGEARLYGESLLHAALSGGSADDPLSRWIFADAARELAIAAAPDRFA